jgi:hypothetical protein
MAEIGRKGFQSLVNRYFNGDAQSAKDWLHLQAAERKIDRLVSESSPPARRPASKCRFY